MVATLAVDQEKLARIKRSVGEDYVPSDDEEYMDERQLDYFRMLLLEWKKSIHDAAEGTLQSLQDGPLRVPKIIAHAARMFPHREIVRRFLHVEQAMPVARPNCRLSG